jgi:hypothetical protein
MYLDRYGTNYGKELCGLKMTLQSISSVSLNWKNGKFSKAFEA